MMSQAQTSGSKVGAQGAVIAVLILTVLQVAYALPQHEESGFGSDGAFIQTNLHANSIAASEGCKQEQMSPPEPTLVGSPAKQDIDDSSMAAMSLMQVQLQRTSSTTQLSNLSMLSHNSSSDEVHQTTTDSKFPAMLFIKIPKTGSSTLTNIMQRVGQKHALTFMLPQGEGVRNWGYPFPGEEYTQACAPPEHQFDVICNHAFANFSLMKAYLKPSVKTFSIVREPSAHVKASSESYESWDACLDKLSSEPDFSVLGSGSLDCFPNKQALFLGWYDYVGHTTKFDNDTVKINKWLQTLDKEMDLIFLIEHYDEGLVLLREDLKADIGEMKYVIFESGGKAETASAEPLIPTEAQEQRLAELNTVDNALYKHANQTFWKRWQKGPTSHYESLLEDLKHLNKQLQNACDRNDTRACPNTTTLRSAEYDMFLPTSC
mmetsp:Transcript_117288/g.203776  ORF Transcript_117288/g.203776 Transcript_117288/m.203776 type:complete len:433 (-) Transcript_117288:53-1351(-)